MFEIIWLGFFVSIIILLLLSRKNLGIALISSSVVLGLFTLPLEQIWGSILSTLTDPSVILLSLAMGVIPLLGGVLQESGQLDDLVHNLRIGQKPFLMLSPALLGLLPIPGGALLSAPLVKRVGKNIKDELKAGVNIWFRHTLLLIYPLSPALIVSAKLAGLQVYEVIPYLFPLFLFSILLGYFFFLRKIKGNLTYHGKFSLKKLSLPLSIILLAPLLDFSLQALFKFEVSELFTFIAVSSSLILALFISKFNLKDIKRIGQEMKPWNFIVIIIGMFIFLRVFKASGVGNLIASLSLSKILLGVVIGFLLALLTGRIQLAASIVIPTLLVTFSLTTLAPVSFALIFFAMFLGYVISPVHPCVSVSLEYFKIKLSDFLKVMFLPTFITFLLTLGLALLFGL